MQKFAGNFSGLFRIAALGVVSVNLLMGCSKTNGDKEPVAEIGSSRLAREMIGTWVHVGSPGRVTEAPENGGRHKLRTGTHWNLTTADPDTGLVKEHFGGTYSLKGDEYVETQTYADENWIQDNGKSFKFTVKIEGDTMTQFGLDNPYTEVWKRVK